MVSPHSGGPAQSDLANETKTPPAIDSRHPWNTTPNRICYEKSKFVLGFPGDQARSTLRDFAFRALVHCTTNTIPFHVCVIQLEYNVILYS